MLLRFAAIIFLSINASVLASSLKPSMHIEAAEKKPPMLEDRSVVRTHDSQQPEEPAHAPHIPSPVLRVQHHMDSVAVDGKGEAENLELPESEVPPVVLQDKPRTPILINPKPASNQSLAQEPAPVPVVRAESHPAHAAVAATKPTVSEAVSVTGEAVPSRIRSRARKQSAKGMALEEADATHEAPESPGIIEEVEEPSIVRAEPHPMSMSETSSQWPPKGAVGETHVILAFLGVGAAIAILALSGVCGGLEKAVARNENDILEEVYAAAENKKKCFGAPGVTLPNKGAFMVPS